MFNLTTLIGWLLFANLSISSPSFTANGNIPSKYSCEGDNTSPALHINGIPPGAQSLAIILQDPDAPMAGGFTHWVAFNIDPLGDIPENFKGGIQAMNGAKKEGYVGPCPPTGTHHYHFMVYALDSKLSIDKTANKEALEKAMQGHILSQGEIVGLYKKSK